MSTAFGSRKTFILQSLFFSLYLIQEAIWTAADWLHIISHYQEPAAVPLPCWFHSQVARFSHLMEKAGNGREWPKWDGGFESDRYSQHQPAQFEAQARPSKAARQQDSQLLFCCSSGLMKCPWSPVRPAFNWLQEHSEEAQTEEVRTNEPEVKRYGPRLWLWWHMMTMSYEGFLLL